MQQPDYRKISEYLRQVSRPDEAIFAGGLDQHDRIFINPVGLYASSGRRPGTHWHQFDPGLQTRADIQTKMIAALKANNVRWIVQLIPPPPPLCGGWITIDCNGVQRRSCLISAVSIGLILVAKSAPWRYG